MICQRCTGICGFSYLFSTWLIPCGFPGCHVDTFCQTELGWEQDECCLIGSLSCHQRVGADRFYLMLSEDGDQRGGGFHDTREWGRLVLFHATRGWGRLVLFDAIRGCRRGGGGGGAGDFMLLEIGGDWFSFMPPEGGADWFYLMLSEDVDGGGGGGGFMLLESGGDWFSFMPPEGGGMWFSFMGRLGRFLCFTSFLWLFANTIIILTMLSCMQL